MSQQQIAMLPSTAIADCDALPEIQNRTCAYLIIDHGNGQMELHSMLSNAVLDGFNEWMRYGYTPADPEQYRDAIIERYGKI